MRVSIQHPGIGYLVGRGLADLRRYTGTALLLYLVQALFSAAVGSIVFLSLSSAFSRHPLFDDGIDGDLPALFTSLMEQGPLLSSLVMLAIVALLCYAIISWALLGGLITVLIRRPHGRADTMAQFGSGAVRCFFPYLKLFLWSLIPWILVLIVAGIGLATASAKLGSAIELSQVCAALVWGLLPAMLLAWWLSTALAYARVDLARHAGMSSLRALGRGFTVVLVRPRALLHAGIYPLSFALVTAAFVFITYDCAFWGAAGAIGITSLRQVTALLRFAGKFAVISGQVEMSQQTLFPPRGFREPESRPPSES